MKVRCCKQSTIPNESPGEPLEWLVPCPAERDIERRLNLRDKSIPLEAFATIPVLWYMAVQGEVPNQPLKGLFECKAFGSAYTGQQNEEND